MSFLYQNLRKVLYIIGKDKNKLPLIAILFLTLSILDVIGVGLIASYLSLFGNLDSFKSELFLYVGEIPLISDETLLFSYLGYGLILLFLIKIFFVYFVNREIFSFAHQTMIRLRTSLMWTYQCMPYSIYMQKNTSEYVHSIQNLTSSLSAVLVGLLTSVSGIITAIAIIVMLIMINPFMVLIFSFFLVGVVLLYDIAFHKKLFFYGKNSNHASHKMIQGISEGMIGLKEIRILGKERYFYNVVMESVSRVAKNNIKIAMIQFMPRYVYEIAVLFFIVLTVTTATTLMNLEPSSLLVTMSVFGIASLRLMPIFSQISTSLTKIRQHGNAISELYGTMKNTKIKKYHHQDRLENENNGSFSLLKINNVSFYYPGMKKPSLENVSMSIYENETIGIIGESGSGKTTLLNILLGLLDVSDGRISYNNTPLDKTLSAWHRQVAYIPQQVFLLDASLKNNVALGEEDNDIDESRVLTSLQQAKLLNFAMQLPDGIETFIGEGGGRLSGGQRQRIALARSFYFNRSVLIMDEATSALDNETEREIIQEIKLLKGRKTIIVVAHRMSTVKNCDRIYRMQDGKIIEKGDFEKIIGRKGLGY